MTVHIDSGLRWLGAYIYIRCVRALSCPVGHTHTHRHGNALGGHVHETEFYAARAWHVGYLVECETSLLMRNACGAVSVEVDVQVTLVAGSIHHARQAEQHLRRLQFVDGAARLKRIIHSVHDGVEYGPFGIVHVVGVPLCQKHLACQVNPPRGSQPLRCTEVRARAAHAVAVVGAVFPLFEGLLALLPFQSCQTQIGWGNGRVCLVGQCAQVVAVVAPSGHTVSRHKAQRTFEPGCGGRQTKG